MTTISQKTIGIRIVYGMCIYLFDGDSVAAIFVVAFNPMLIQVGEDVVHCLGGFDKMAPLVRIKFKQVFSV